MESYKILITEEPALLRLNSLYNSGSNSDPNYGSYFYKEVCRQIRMLAGTPNPPNSHPITLNQGWYIRVCDYIVIYDIYPDNETIIILDIINPHQEDNMAGT